MIYFELRTHGDFAPKERTFVQSEHLPRVGDLIRIERDYVKVFQVVHPGFREKNVPFKVREERLLCSDELPVVIVEAI